MAIRTTVTLMEDTEGGQVTVELSGARRIFSIFIWVVVTWVNMYVKIYQGVQPRLLSEPCIWTERMSNVI